MLNQDIGLGQSVVIHSNPVNVNEVATDPPANVTWARDTDAFGEIVVGPGLGKDCSFVSTKGTLGITTITMAQGGKVAQVTVTVVGATPLPFDHFSPFFDPPSTE